MRLQDAIESGKPFKLPSWGRYYTVGLKVAKDRLTTFPAFKSDDDTWIDTLSIGELTSNEWELYEPKVTIGVRQAAVAIREAYTSGFEDYLELSDKILAKMGFKDE